MARIDFDTRNTGKQIHDAGEYEIPPELHQAEDQNLALPQRFGINKSENPPIIFDRFPGWSDADAKKESAGIGGVVVGDGVPVDMPDVPEADSLLRRRAKKRGEPVEKRKKKKKKKDDSKEDL